MEIDDELKKRPKQSFSENWLSNDRLKVWIRKVPFNNSLFYCTICEQNYSCNSIPTRHMKSTQHKRNIEKATSYDSDNSSATLQKTPLRKQIFRQQWLDIEEYKPWLREAQHDANSFLCTICDKTFAGASLSRIQHHAESKTHKDKFEKCDTEISKLNKDLNMQIDKSFLLFEEQKKSAEIRYAALIADKNIPLKTGEMILNFFQNIGKNPNVLKCMRMGATKCTNIISNVLCPVETNCLVKKLQNTKFSIYIDEMSNISNENWTFHVRYVNPETLQVHSQLVKLIDVDAADYSADKLFNAFKREMLKLEIPFSNIVALLCNSGMTEELSSFKKKLEEVCEKILILSCPCYSVAIVAHIACAKIPQVCEEFAKEVANYINSNPKRRTVFRELSECFQEKNYKILKLPETRWISHYTYIKKLLESWDTIKYLLSETVINEKTKSEENLLCIMQNVETKAYLLFLNYILHSFHTFNTFFEVTETRIHLLYWKAIDFLTEICKNFLKSEVLEYLSNTIFSKIKNHKHLADVNLGSECEEYLCQLMIDGYNDVVESVRQNCLQFYVIAAEEIRERLPFNDVFLSKLKVFLPQIALGIQREISFNDLSFIANTIGDFDENALKKEWFTLHLDLTTIEKQNLSKLNFDDMWMQILQRNEYASTNELYPNLKSLLSCVQSFPNSNADSERISSFLTDIKTKKRNRLSSTAVNSIYVLKSALKTRGETALNMKIDAKHLSLMSSDKLYVNYIPKKQKNAVGDIASRSSFNDI